MPKEVFEVSQPVQPTETKPTNWPKIILAAVLGLGLLFGATYAGYWYGAQQVQTVEKPTTVSQPTPTPTPTPEPPPTPMSAVEDETKGWKTYTNNLYKYSFMYPENYTLSENDEIAEKFPFVTQASQVVKVRTPKPLPGGGYPIPTVYAAVYKGYSSIDGWLVRRTTSRGFTEEFEGKSNILFFNVGSASDSTLNGLTAKTFSSTLFESSPDVVVAIKGDVVYSLILDKENKTKDPYIIEVFPKILSTFKFLD